MKKVVLLMVATVLLVLILASVAQAAKPTTTTFPYVQGSGSPWDIYYDYADNRHLDGTYTQEQLQAYLDDPTIHQYGSRGVYVPLDNLVRRMLGGTSTNPTSTTTTVAGATTDYPDTFPFTGFEVLVALGGGLLLLGAGFAARRRAPR